MLAGRRGHIALMDWADFKLTREFQIKETIRDVKYVLYDIHPFWSFHFNLFLISCNELNRWLHDETMIAVAQKKYTYIYDNTGTELHVLRDHIEVNALEYLPYHFLLASVGKAGWLKYQDVSTGEQVHLAAMLPLPLFMSVIVAIVINCRCINNTTSY
jgi:U3 small nucleolar RNA-associated protein 7